MFKREERDPDVFYVTRVRLRVVNADLPDELMEAMGATGTSQAAEVIMEDWNVDFPSWEDAVRLLQEKHLVNPEDWIIDNVALMTGVAFFAKEHIGYIIRCGSATNQCEGTVITR